MKDFTTIVLAAGKGTRMKSKKPKVLHSLCGNPLIFYPLEALRKLGSKDVTVVVGYGAQEVQENFAGTGMDFCLQKDQLGTGHAVMCAVKGRKKKNLLKDTLILSGDVPLLKENTLKELFKVHRRRQGKSKNKTEKIQAVTLLSVFLADPTGYGRIIRDMEGRIERIVEQKDLKGDEGDTCEVNTGIYLFDTEFLHANLKKLGTKNAQKEYYLPDLVALAFKRGLGVSSLTHTDPGEVMGVNDRVELSRASSIMRERVLRELMAGGTTLINPFATYIDYGVKTGQDTTIYPNVHLSGNTTVGRDCVIEEGVKIHDSKIGNGTTVRSYSVIESSVVGKGATVGPFARLRPGAKISDNARIGNFVEIKKSTIGRGSKVNHLSYIGDAVIGKDVNIGAGTITCNYDGVNKHQTVIKDGAFIGSDSQFIAPVTVGKNAYIGSGSTITKDVPPDSLALARAELVILKGWVKERASEKKKEKKNNK